MRVGTIGVRGVAVATVVPALAVGAHALASGASPGPLGIALCIALGLVAGVLAGPRCSRVGLLMILSTGQAASHLALSVGMSTTGATSMHSMGGASHMHDGADPMSGPTSMLTDHLAVIAHPGSVDGALMLLTHLVAIPLCAMLIGLAAAVAAMATVVVAVLTRPVITPATDVVFPISGCTSTRARRIDRAAGPGTRGPPVRLAVV